MLIAFIIVSVYAFGITGYHLQKVALIAGWEKWLFMVIWPVYLAIWYCGLAHFSIKKAIKARRKRKEEQAAILANR